MNIAPFDKARRQVYKQIVKVRMLLDNRRHARSIVTMTSIIFICGLVQQAQAVPVMFKVEGPLNAE